MKTKSCFITLLITSIILPCGVWTSPVAAATPYIFVNGQCGNDAWSGEYSQCSAPNGYKRTIQAALDAIPDGGVVAVRDGIYAGDGNRDLDFKGKAVWLLGSGPETCSIDCGGARTENHRAFHFHTGEDSNSIVQGFTITNGVAYKGGAVLCSNSSPKFVNCIFRNNEATDDDTGGGAMYNEDSSPVLENCTFTGNIAMPSASFGGAISNKTSSPTLTDCIFINNNAWCGGGIYNTNSSNPVLQNCAFLNNQATMGAAMGNRQSTPQLRRCTFTCNSAIYFGGGMYNRVSSNPALTHCVFTGNSAHTGGAMSNGSSGPAITNCLFAGNAADSLGGAVANDSSTTMFVNCTIYGNSASFGSGVASFDESRVTTTNSILWDNSPNQIYNDDPACNQILFSCVEGRWPGTGNTDVDPLFADAAGGDYHLKSQAGRWDSAARAWVQDGVTSPCTDAGDPASAIMVEPFPNGGVVNMGAYGGTVEASKSYFGKPPCKTMVAGDINGDCKVGLADFAIMAMHWLAPNNP